MFAMVHAKALFLKKSNIFQSFDLHKHSYPIPMFFLFRYHFNHAFQRGPKHGAMQMTKSSNGDHHDHQTYIFNNIQALIYSKMTILRRGPRFVALVVVLRHRHCGSTTGGVAGGWVLWIEIGARG
jgi:hypothetical protein